MRLLGAQGSGSPRAPFERSSSLEREDARGRSPAFHKVGGGEDVGVLVGGATVYVWRAYLEADWWNLYELIPAFALGLVATVVVSLMTNPPPDVDEMFAEMET